MKIEFDILEKYCEGRMQKAEKDAFEEAMRADAGLSDEVKSYFLSKAAIASASNLRLKKHLDEMGQELDLSDVSGRRFIQYILAAAGICLLIGMGWMMMHFFGFRKTTGEIYLAHYERPDVSEFAERSIGSDSSLVTWNTALDNFSRHEILKASREFEQLTDNQGTIPFSHVYFMLAICAMESNDFEKATAAFDHVKSGSNFVFATQYYKALCLIKMNKKPEATDLLRSIKSQSAHPYRKQARRLLRMLNKV
jgi:hypothetical protein